ncbi:MAG: SurA N-terminal domain-containing protein, partial [Gammaproteobacteria bacterium]
RMLTKIREKAQGVFAWVILLLIGIPFALWGIQNYLDFGKETPVASVGDKDFFQRDVNRAYAQYSQSLQGLGIDEATLKKQALQKLIRDEALLQYVNSEDLKITDETARNFIKTLDYFQVDGHFDKDRYQSVLNAQGMSPTEFVGRIKNALAMEQFQHSIVDSGFATPYDAESFFKIQNQKRNIEYLTVAVKSVTEKPSDEDVEAYYRQHLDNFRTPEKIAVEYIDLSVDDLAKEVEATDEQLKSYYEEQKSLYTSKERRKISHILFAFNKNTDEEAALAKAKQAKERLTTEDFAKVAEELSDDKLTAKNGGDLGPFEVGVMEPAFEQAASALQLGEVSEPVKSSFGYHLIKVTELIPASTKPFETVRNEVDNAYRKAQAENTFYDLSETLTELSYEHPDTLTDASDAIGIKIRTSAMFSRDAGEGIASETKVREAAFSADVLQGNNSEPVELGKNRIIVLRKLDYQPASTRELDEVRQQVESVLMAEKAKSQAETEAAELKKRLQAGESVQALAEDAGLNYKKFDGLTRTSTDVSPQLLEAVFKAAKPEGGKASVFVVALDTGDQAVVNLSHVEPGAMSEDDKKRMELALTNIARAYGQTMFNAVLDSLQNQADITVKSSE